MHDILRVAMIDGLEELLHVLRRLSFRERLVYLLANLFEEWHACYVLHD